MKSKIIFKLVILLYLCVFTKSFSQDNNVTIDPEMIINVNVDKIENLSDNYNIDVSNLQFNSETEFLKFCEMVSFDFYTLSGNYKNQQISISFDKKSLLERQLTIEKMNSFFTRISKRLKYVYTKLNKQ